MKYLLFLVVLLNSLSQIKAQIGFPVNGVKHPESNCYLFKNAFVQLDPWTNAQELDVLIRNERIVEIAKTIEVPADAQVLYSKGLFIYPGFIDLFSSYGMPSIPERKASGRGQNEKQREGAYAWNDALKTEQNAAEIFKIKQEQARFARENGFVLVNTHMPDGISRGSSCLVHLGETTEHASIFKAEVHHVLSFQKGSSTQDYPGSLMGAIALIRQTYLDGMYFENHPELGETNISILKWNELQKLPTLFISDNKWDIQRANKISKEFGKQFFIKGTGSEYQNIAEIKKLNPKLILPLKFPSLYDVEDPLDADQVELSDLKHWELAPYNPALMEKNGIDFCITMDGTKDNREFLHNLRLAVKNGLSRTRALESLTTLPAEWLGISSHTGSLSKGKFANFIISNGDVFADSSQILEVWVQGKKYVHNTSKPDQYSGFYRFIFNKDSFEVELVKKDNKYEFKFDSLESLKRSGSVFFEDYYMSGQYKIKDEKQYPLYGIRKGDNWVNATVSVEIPFFKLVKSFKSYPEQSKKKDLHKPQMSDTGNILHPFMSYGWQQKPISSPVLFKNVTVWTCETEGKLLNTDVIIYDGKIQEVGKNLKSKRENLIVVDGTGKHLTPGLIDEHNHIAISRGVNECSQSSTAEVRISDVINPDDINIFRQLAGGLTTAQLLHGSCNPIGGQSALIKLRWGSSPEEMRFDGADGFIKFALGENVKRSGSSGNNRYPDSRMGVEQVYLDYFTRARIYLQEIKKKGPAHVRRDLDLETIGEILEGKRFITCHSYVQSEINMLMNLMEKFNVRVNTFTHILEGYKVADKMKQHGAGASSFSDWWAYKFEVYDAIPYNGAILHNQGVVTAFNSDDAEMARRLNQEAAKAIKYGGIHEEEALKFVTLNPAKLLHIDHRVGSIRVGKDADLVLWNDHPLSVYAQVDMTFVDGIKYFDSNELIKIKEGIAKERNRLIHKMIELKESGVKTNSFKSPKRRLYHCDTIGDTEFAEEEYHLD